MHRIIHGGIVLSLGIFITKALGFLYIIPLYKIVGSQVGEILSYIFIPFTILLFLANFGMNSTMTKFVAEKNTNLNKILENSIVIIRFTSIISFLVLFILAKPIMIIVTDNNLELVDQLVPIVRILSLALLIVPFNFLLKGYFQGHEKYRYVSNANVLEQVVKVIIIFFAIGLVYFNFLDVSKTFFIIYVLSVTISALIVTYYLWSKIPKETHLIYFKKIKSNREITKKIIFFSMPILFSALIINIYSLIDLLTINMNLNSFVSNINFVKEEIIANYLFWAPKLLLIPLTLMVGFTTSIIPGIAKKGENNQKINYILTMGLFLGITISLFMFFNSRELFTLFYGPNELGIISLQLLSLTAVFWIIRMIIISILIAKGYSKALLVTIIISLISKIILNYFIGTDLVLITLNTIISITLGIIYGIYILQKKTKFFQLRFLLDLVFLITYSILSIKLLSWIKNTIDFNYVIIDLIISGLIYVALFAIFALIYRKMGKYE